MFDVKISDDLIRYANKQTEQYNFGKRYTANGNREQQTTGVLAQSKVGEWFDHKWVDGSFGCDNGTDIEVSGITIDVKCMGRKSFPKPHYVNNFYELQLYFKTDIIVFTSYHKDAHILTICGWCTKEELKKLAKHFQKGEIRTRDDGTIFEVKDGLLEIRNDQLHNVQSVDDLKDQMFAFATTKQANPICSQTKN